jgi:hypothetical protein
MVHSESAPNIGGGMLAQHKNAEGSSSRLIADQSGHEENKLSGLADSPGRISSESLDDII